MVGVRARPRWSPLVPAGPRSGAQRCVMEWRRPGPRGSSAGCCGVPAGVPAVGAPPARSRGCCSWTLPKATPVRGSARPASAPAALDVRPRPAERLPGPRGAGGRPPKPGGCSPGPCGAVGRPQPRRLVPGPRGARRRPPSPAAAPRAPRSGGMPPAPAGTAQGRATASSGARPRGGRPAAGAGRRLRGRGRGPAVRCWTATPGLQGLPGTFDYGRAWGQCHS